MHTYTRPYMHTFIYFILKEVSYVHQGCIYLIKNTIQILYCEILDIKMVLFDRNFSNLI